MTLPKGWATAALGGLSGYVTSGSRGWARYYADDGPAFLRVQNIRRQNINLDWEDVQCVAPPPEAEGARTRLKALDILVTITADLGRVGLFDSERDAFVNQHVALVRLLQPAAAPFVSRFLTTEDAQRQLGLRDRGVTRAGLGLDDLRGVEIPVPPLAEQRRIVAKLDALTARLARARAELARVQQLSETLRERSVIVAFKGLLTKDWSRVGPDGAAMSDAELEEHYANLVGERRRRPAASIDWQPSITLPSRWRWVSIDKIVAAIDYGTSAKTSDADGSTPILRMGNLQAGEIDWKSLKYLPNDHPDLAGLLLQPGDVLFNRTNSFELVGKTALFRGHDHPVSFASYLIRLRPCGILPILLVRYLNSAFARQWVERVASQQVGQANVNGSKLKALGIPLAPPDEQKEIVRRLDAVFARADRLEAEAARTKKLLDRLEAAILARAFRGELVPQDPADEPAAVLLDRIRAERAEAPKAKRGRRKGDA